MNQIAIGIKLNERQVLIAVAWPTKQSLKALVRLKLARLKHKARQIANNIAMAIIPLPNMATA